MFQRMGGFYCDSQLNHFTFPWYDTDLTLQSFKAAESDDKVTEGMQMNLKIIAPQIFRWLGGLR